MDPHSSSSAHFPDHTDPDWPDGSGRHPVNLTHLIMGIAFLGFAGIWAAIAADLVPDDNLQWLLPVPWLLAGSAGLLATTVSQVRRTRRHGQVGMIGDHTVHAGVQEDPGLRGQVTDR